MNHNTTKRVHQSAVASQAKACWYDEPEAVPTQTAEEARQERLAESLRERAEIDRLRKEADERWTLERRQKYA
jgi:hypothetical protein